MKRKAFVMAALSLALVAANVSTVQADALVGQPAPSFTAADTNGKSHALTDFKGKYVVLEWTNYDCPFVVKQYSTQAMQEMQKMAAGKGVVWLSVNSSAAGKQGNYPAEKWNTLVKEKGAAPKAILLDGDGKIGQLYGAKTTPHMYIINPEGKLIYNGAIDDKPTTDAATKPQTNYVAAALTEAMAGKPVTVATTRPYGCSVKY
ncbi:thioredoxin family protein [Gloeobacter violaceus]|uniref:Glr3964 protein n=1 Tax=Gloeobacter violaceus (strain ATCC 29082 / PCC 7421) TaxID=251221 RepID=Q7NEB6_GLOVI|nr:thioredoxin family protein [Gloeobacter violaceus]BAC91905.1 glr3964 [Gloeobacter violaceus PCC 7421]